KIGLCPGTLEASNRPSFRRSRSASRRSNGAAAELQRSALLKTDMSAAMTPQVINLRISKSMARRRLAETIRLLCSNINVVRDDPKLSWSLAWCYFKIGKYDLSRRHMQRSTRLAPRDPIALWGLGIVHLQTDRNRKAEQCFRTSLAIQDRYLT